MTFENRLHGMRIVDAPVKVIAITVVIDADHQGFSHGESSIAGPKAEQVKSQGLDELLDIVPRPEIDAVALDGFGEIRRSIIVAVD